MTPKPLAGLSVVVTRPREQAPALNDLLEAAGATTVEVPVIEIVDPVDGGTRLDSALSGLGPGDWLVVTSPNGAARAARAAAEIGLAAGVRVAAIGPGTRARAEADDLAVTLVPSRSIAEGLLEVFPEPPAGGGQVVLARAEVARQVLPDGLRLMGWSVTDVAAYRTIPVAVGPEAAEACGAADVVAFASSSAVAHLVDAVGVSGLPPAIASIGPATSATVSAHGLKVDVEAELHTLAGLVEAVVARFGS